MQHLIEPLLRVHECRNDLASVPILQKRLGLQQPVKFLYDVSDMRTLVLHFFFFFRPAKWHVNGPTIISCV